MWGLWEILFCDVTLLHASDAHDFLLLVMHSITVSHLSLSMSSFWQVCATGDGLCMSPVVQHLIHNELHIPRLDVKLCQFLGRLAEASSIACTL